jgi:hypothetical protein
VLHVWGQAQRVCNKCGDAAHVQQRTGDGKVCVRGQKGFDFRLPINKLVHCNGVCGATDPGKTQPPNEPRAPYIAPHDWDLLVIGDQKALKKSLWVLHRIGSKTHLNDPSFLVLTS